MSTSLIIPELFGLNRMIDDLSCILLRECSIHTRKIQLIRRNCSLLPKSFTNQYPAYASHLSTTSVHNL